MKRQLLSAASWAFPALGFLMASGQAQAQASPSLPSPQQVTPPTPSGTIPATGAADDAAAPVAAAPAEPANGDIIVTATRRSEALSRVPIAVSAVSGRQLALTGGTDIKGLVQLAPSLNVNTSSSETTAVARVRNIGTAGANFGLESSVATFVDGVYRARSGIALGELGDVERVEVLRGPQGTLFGRNASAGLINVVSQGPEFTWGGHAQADIGNYAEHRFDAMLTGPIKDDVAAFRLQGIYETRDGFFRDAISGRDLNNRDRYFLRGQLLLKPAGNLSIRIIGDYTHRDEECCLANFKPARTVTRDASGNLVFSASSLAALERGLGAVINDDPTLRVGSITPGQSFRSPVRDGGVSGQVDWTLGQVKLTSITAYRDYRNVQALDPDFSNLDLLTRTRNVSALSNFSQEVRVQGAAFAGHLDWLVGGYFAREHARNEDNLGVGRQYGVFQACQVVGGLASSLGLPASTVSPASPGCFAPAIRPVIGAALGAAGPPLLAGFDRLYGYGNVAVNDVFRQDGTNFAFFTHNNIKLTERLTVTAGLRWTHDRKALNADLAGPTGICAAQRAGLGALTGAGIPAAVQSLAGTLITLSCGSGIGDSALNGSYANSTTTSEFTGTAVVSYRPVDALLTYASYSRGYKAGGYNLDRSGLSVSTPTAQRAATLAFAPEFVDSYEVGAKLNVRGFRLNAAAFWEQLSGLQYSIFNGTNFVVVNIDGCKQAVTAVAGVLPSLGTCGGGTRSGAYSRGVELEGAISPARDVSVQTGFTLADTRFRRNIVGAGGTALPNGLALLPGNRLAYAPLYTVSAGATFTPDLGSRLKGLAHVDVRLQSDFNTGSDLFAEKAQDSIVLVNARLGISTANGRWAIEGWARNLLDTTYSAVVASAPTQGSGTQSYVAQGYATSATSLFTNLLADPRTYGLTLRVGF